MHMERAHCHRGRNAIALAGWRRRRRGGAWHEPQLPRTPCSLQLQLQLKSEVLQREKLCLETSKFAHFFALAVEIGDKAMGACAGLLLE